MKKENNNKKKPNYINKVNTTRIDRNRKRYRQVVPKKSISPLFLFLFLLSILGNFFLVGHYITFDHNKVRVETKTRKVVTVSPNYLFLGDSITEMYDLEKYFPDDPVVNSGVSGDATHDILEDMEKRVYQYNPSKVFLLIGTNDLQDGKTPDEIFENIKRIVEGIQENRPEAKIYLESIYPVNRNFENSGAQDRHNEDIKEINKKIFITIFIVCINLLESFVLFNNSIYVLILNLFAFFKTLKITIPKMLLEIVIPIIPFSP